MAANAIMTASQSSLIVGRWTGSVAAKEIWAWDLTVTSGSFRKTPVII
jgi:hypothetical protein